MKKFSPVPVVLGLLVVAQSAAAGGPGTTRGIIDIGKPKRPADAVTLVGPDGYNLVPEGEAPTKWVFADGILTASPGWDSVLTRESYRDFRMHVEFNVNEVKDAKDPEANGNSGIYIQNRYEIQIHNSFGVPEADYKASYCGSIYRRKKPDRLVCKKAGEWQNFDIVFRAARFDIGKKTENARITVYQNGELIHDDYSIPGKTGSGEKEGPEPRPIKLQGHHNPVRFRNVWIQKLSLGAEEAKPAAKGTTSVSAAERTDSRATGVAVAGRSETAGGVPPCVLQTFREQHHTTMSKNMLAAVLHGIQDLRVDERAVPELEPGKALVRVRRGGICGSDVHYFEEGRFGSFAVTAPFVLGHEVAGEVVAVADGVSQPAVGQRVVVNPSRQCGHCDYCRSGRGNLCRHVRMLGSASTKPPTNGGFSEYLLIGAEQCFPVPPQIDDGLGAMIEPFAVALHALKRVGSVVGKPVIVTGGGPIGLLTVIAARACGATTIAVSDPVAERRQMALQVGADSALDPTEASFKDQVTALTGDGFEILFEASGAVPALRQAFEVVRRGGTIVQIGVYSAPEISLPVNQLLVRELQFVGSFRYGNVWEEAIRLVASGRVNLQPLISRVLPLKQAAEALALACAKTGVVKVQIDLT